MENTFSHTRTAACVVGWCVCVQFHWTEQLTFSRRHATYTVAQSNNCYLQRDPPPVCQRWLFEFFFLIRFFMQQFIIQNIWSDSNEWYSLTEKKVYLLFIAFDQIVCKILQFVKQRVPAIYLGVFSRFHAYLDETSGPVWFREGWTAAGVPELCEFS